ncbi:MAG: SURF1 family protein [Proteobacteria bacterium]|nr:SURF1 family protein [Pseudomonadota bacterium]
MSLLALAFFLLCLRAASWQWHKGVLRQQEWERFARGSDRVVELGADAARLPLYQRVRVTGRLDGGHQFLLDNISLRGRPGYEVLTPLLRSGAPALLVDRGWVAFTGSRKRLPDVSLAPGAEVTLTGRVATLPVAGLAMGRAAPTGTAWPLVTSFPTMAELTAAAAMPLAPRILLLDPGTPPGYERDWRPPGFTPLRHYSYAIQWWAFAALTLILWSVMSWRRRKTSR